MTIIRVKRGTDSQIQSGSMATGELAFATDTKRLYVYDGTSKIDIGDKVAASWISPGTIGSTTPNSISLTTLNTNGNVNLSSLPTSDSGLNVSDLWNDSGVLKVYVIPTGFSCLCPNNDPSISITVSGNSGSVTWLGETWTPAQSGETRRVCPDTYINTKSSTTFLEFWQKSNTNINVPGALNLKRRSFSSTWYSPTYWGSSATWLRQKGSNFIGIAGGATSGTPTGTTFVVGPYQDRKWASQYGSILFPTSNYTGGNTYNLGIFNSITNNIPNPFWDSDKNIPAGFFGSKTISGVTYTWGRNSSDCWRGRWEDKRVDTNENCALSKNSLKSDGDNIISGNQQDGTIANAQGSAYVYNKDQGGPDVWGKIKTLVPSDSGTYRYFGISSDIDGDDVIVGAQGRNTVQGAAYIYNKNYLGSNNWGEFKKLTASDGATGDSFGFDVAIDGDNIVVGGPGINSQQGAVYIFNRNQGGPNSWGQVQKLTASDGATGDFFGNSVSIDGSTIVIGAGQGFSTTQGKVYIFDYSTSWTQTKIITASDGSTNYGSFGFSASIDGDNVIIGARYGTSSIYTSQGQAYIYNRNYLGSNNWGEVQIIYPSNPVTGGQFADIVSIKGEVAIVGQRTYSDNIGSGFRYNMNEGGPSNWGLAYPLAASDGSNQYYLGYALDIDDEKIVMGGRVKTSAKLQLFMYDL